MPDVVSKLLKTDSAVSSTSKLKIFGRPFGRNSFKKFFANTPRWYQSPLNETNVDLHPLPLLTYFINYFMNMARETIGKTPSC